MLLGYFLPLPKYDVMEEFQIDLVVTPGLAETKYAGWKYPLNRGICGVPQTVHFIC